jgi:acyl-coenzyme A thioesterase PaaI-like protein
MNSPLENMPAGYTPHFRKSPLTEPWEPLFSKVENATVVLGVRVRDPHCNGKGFLHGGLIAALANNAMGLSVIEVLSQESTDRARSGSTVSLTVDFLAPAAWLEFVPRVLKVGANIAFTDCLVLADGEPIARGNAVFRYYSAQSSGVT